MDAIERRDRATEEASYWWHRLGTQAPAAVSAQDREQFTQWLRESPVHVAEMLHIAHVHDVLGRFQLWKDVATGPAGVDPKVIPLQTSDPKDRRPRKRRTRRYALAAAVAAIVTTAVLLPQLGGQVIVTERAERREVMLRDGSVIKLEPQTRLRVELNARERRIALEQGRALFHVAKDRARPFLVQADATVVRAIGTAFGVEWKNRNVVVTVAEGEVAVLPTAEAGRDSPSANDRDEKYASGQAAVLTAGKQVTVQPSGTAEPVRDVDTARALAWAEGRLVFDSAPLSEVAEEFNRYNHVQLRIEGDELGRRPVSGVFQASDPETLIAFVRAGARVSVTYQDQQRILIVPAR